MGGFGLERAIGTALNSALALSRVWSQWFWSFLQFPAGDSAPPPPPSRRQELRVKIWEVRRLLRTAASAGVERDAFIALDTLARNRGRIERAVVVWVDLIEVLVQTQERRFGPGSGLGGLKAQEVKDVLRYLLNSERFGIPNVPDYLRPVVIDVLVSWLIDAVVQITNSYGMWIDEESERSRLGTTLTLLRVRLKKLFRPVGEAVLRAFAALWRLFRRRPALSPRVRAAVEAVEREGLIATEGELIKGATDLLVWVGTHRKQLIAGLELIFTAVQEAESYGRMSGPEKKAYARDLVLAALDELGFRERAGLLFAVVDSMISGGIESAVSLFNKRGVFST